MQHVDHCDDVERATTEWQMNAVELYAWNATVWSKAVCHIHTHRNARVQEIDVACRDPTSSTPYI